MKTKIFSSKNVSSAAKLIRRGDVVAFPTETVFGLGANAFDSSAIKKIFRAKGRPSDNPLIVHIARTSDLKLLVSSIPAYAEKFIKAFWPGPLTFIFSKSSRVSLAVTAGLGTVAVRFPKNRVAQALIRASNVPIAAPSANMSGKPSGTTFVDVFEDFNGKIAGIVKSKKSSIGLESSVVDCSGPIPLLLRPGSITLEDLRSVVPSIKLYRPKRSHSSPKSPGLKYKHYAPKAQVFLFEKSAHAKLREYKSSLQNGGKKVRVLDLQKNVSFSKKLFSTFRSCDRDGVDCILIKSISESGLGLAIMDRVRKAATKIVK